jgi:hypothetical protein
MSSKLFSVLKIVAIAMLLTWAVSSPTQAVAGPQCNSGCEQGCVWNVQMCAEDCYGGVAMGDYGPAECLDMCNSDFMGCLASCGCLN